MTISVQTLWTGAAAKCGGEREAVLLARETGPKKGNDAGWALPILGVLQGSESSLWLQSGEAVKEKHLATVFPDQ